MVPEARFLLFAGPHASGALNYELSRIKPNFRYYIIL